jgi:hypothetical protein
LVVKNASNDLYLLQDGTYAAPGDCKAGKDGVMRNKNGLAVVLRADGEPQTLMQGAVDNKNVEAAQVGKSELAPNDVAAPAVDMSAMAAASAQDDKANVKSEPAKTGK